MRLQSEEVTWPCLQCWSGRIDADSIDGDSGAKRDSPELDCPIRARCYDARDMINQSRRIRDPKRSAIRLRGSAGLLLGAVGFVLLASCSGDTGTGQVPSSALKQRAHGFWVPDVDSSMEALWQAQLEDGKEEYQGADAVSKAAYLQSMRPFTEALVSNIAMHIDGDSIVTVNGNSGGGAETVSYEVAGVVPVTNSIHIQVTDSGKTSQRRLTIEGDTLLMKTGDRTAKYHRVTEAEFERRRDTPGL